MSMPAPATKLRPLERSERPAVCRPLYLAMLKSPGGRWQVGPVSHDVDELKRKLADFIGIDQLAIYELSGLPC